MSAFFPQSTFSVTPCLQLILTVVEPHGEAKPGVTHSHHASSGPYFLKTSQCNALTELIFYYFLTNRNEEAIAE